MIDKIETIFFTFWRTVSRMAATNVYVLRLEGGKYYVGKSEDVQKRFQDHLYGHGSEWTKHHKPIAIEIVYENVSPFEEDRITKEYMAKYGIENVRGGVYVQTKLSQAQQKTLLTEIRGANDACVLCGGLDHFVKDCPRRTREKAYEPHTTGIICYTCHQPGHKSPDCPMKAQNTIHAREIDPKQVAMFVNFVSRCVAPIKTAVNKILTPPNIQFEPK